jgi:DNA (cytosine-5)-methyltransferase 1
VRYLSLFSGIEACTQAWHPLGWLPVAFAEIEPFPCAVLAHHYPDVPNLGSVTDITDEQIKALGPIDLVVGGSPCQDLSVAGKRAGFDGERSSLFFEQMRIFHAARRLCGARWLLWENVPGAFSSNRGADFAAVVGEMAGCEFGVPRNGWKSAGVAVGPNGLCEWRVLDAQYFGLAQRRRRVFALLDTGDWHSRQPVLLEPESLRGDSPPSRETQQAIADGAISRALTSSHTATGRLDPNETTFIPTISGSLTANDLNDPNDKTFLPSVAFTQNQQGEVRTDDVVGALTSGGVKPGQGCPAAMQGMAVRRLTPEECESLQGFPRGFTQIPYRKKPAHQCPDGPRYKALGNSMAVPVMRWIGERIQAIAEQRTAMTDTLQDALDCAHLLAEGEL